ncbi:alpha/beta fold hydrolase [Stigmatella aurantiaca]|nr:alpha/beta hydrolase [Stigmatella aurantiaca]
MSFRRVIRFVTAPDGSRIAYHTHCGDWPDETLQRERAGWPPVLLTNGIGSSEHFWRYIVANLETDHRVVHWNYRGHGQSDDSASGDYRIPVHVDDLEQVTEAVMKQGNGRPPHHIAFSMGVRVVLELYRRRPDLVPAMTLIAGPPGATGGQDERWATRMGLGAVRRLLRAATPVVPLASPAVRAFLGSSLAYPAGRLAGTLRSRAPREDIREFFAAVSRMSPIAYWRTLLGLMEGDAWDVLPAVTVPVQLIAAADDQIVPLRDMQRMRQLLPHAHWLLVKDAGHAGLLEAGSEIADAVRTFLVNHCLEPAAPSPP